MNKRSLGTALTRQWMWFAVVLSLLFSGLSLLTLYILEDHFLDQKLRSVAQSVSSVAQSVSSVAPRTALPAGIEIFAADALPADLRAKFAGRSDGAHSEFRRANGRYVHALRARSSSGESFLLVYDVTDEMTVNRALSRYWIYALALLALFALSARLLARLFMRRWSDSAARLLEQVRESESPAALRQYAEQEPVQEFAELARRNADSWQEKLDALAREQELLAFLAHELRTPLQSARTTIEFLSTTASANTTATSEPWARLVRAIKRLERVSHSIRWLARKTNDDTETYPALDITPVLNELLVEFQPLAQRKGVTLELKQNGAPRWPIPAVVAETLLANLLLNALHHGDTSPIIITLDADSVTVDNGMEPGSNSAGSGLGLQIVQRWAAQFDLQVAHEITNASRYSVRVCALKR